MQHHVWKSLLVTHLMCPLCVSQTEPSLQSAPMSPLLLKVEHNFLGKAGSSWPLPGALEHPQSPLLKKAGNCYYFLTLK